MFIELVVEAVRVVESTERADSALDMEEAEELVVSTLADKLSVVLIACPLLRLLTESSVAELNSAEADVVAEADVASVCGDATDVESEDWEFDVEELILAFPRADELDWTVSVEEEDDVIVGVSTLLPDSEDVSVEDELSVAADSSMAEPNSSELLVDALVTETLGWSSAIPSSIEERELDSDRLRLALSDKLDWESTDSGDAVDEAMLDASNEEAASSGDAIVDALDWETSPAFTDASSADASTEAVELVSTESSCVEPVSTAG